MSTAGLTLPVTVSPIDSLGNVVPTYRGTLHLSSTDVQARLPADRVMGAVDAGLVTLNPILVTAGNQNLTIVDVANSNIAGGITGIAVSAAPASKLALSMPSSSSAGVALGGVVLRAQDAFGNTAPSFVGVVNLSSGDANATLPTPVTFNSAAQGNVSLGWRHHVSHGGDAVSQRLRQCECACWGAAKHRCGCQLRCGQCAWGEWDAFCCCRGLNATSPCVLMMAQAILSPATWAPSMSAAPTPMPRCLLTACLSQAMRGV